MISWCGILFNMDDLHFMKIKLYTTTTCPYCKQEKTWLDSKGVKYENVFVDEDEKAAKEMIEITGHQGVPVTLVTHDDGSKKAILGFQKSEISKLLDL